MSGQLCWLPNFSSNGKLALHLRLEPFHPWKPYTAFPGLCIPDYPIAGGSKGWATCQKLLSTGWTAIPTNRSRSSFDEPINSLMNGLSAQEVPPTSYNELIHQLPFLLDPESKN